MEDPNKLVNDITLFAENEAIRNAKKITDELGYVVNDTSMYPRLPIRLFTKYFAKAFTGQELMTAQLRNMWIDVAKSSSQRVIVFDENNNTVMFIVPPLLNASNTESVLNSRLRVDQVFDEYNARSKNSPVIGRNYLYAKLGGIAEVMTNKDNKEFTELQKEWKIIYDYYGIDFNNPGKPLNNTNAATNNVSQNNLSTDDFIEL